MNFALTPTDAPPRLIRFVKPAEMPASDVVATLDPVNNILRIDQEVFFLLDSLDQHLLVRTLEPFVRMEDVNLGR